MPQPRECVSPASFYDALAKGYDAMTGFAERLARAERFAGDLAERHHVLASRAIDVGCGTGAYTLALARLGVSTVGVDPSPEMIQQARANARRLELSGARFVQGGLADVAGAVPKPAEVLVCMGNTLPHILTGKELLQGLVAARQALAERGVLALQLLNYQAVLASRERVVSIDTEAGESFVRFYDFLPDGLVRFNLLRFPQEGGSHTLTGVLLRPYQRAGLEALLAEAGFVEVNAFGSLAFGPFDPFRSETLLLTARA